jgi:hypothetical protein
MSKLHQVYGIVALAAAAATLFATLEPSFAKVGGGPIGLGIVAAGFAIASALRPRS